MILECGREGNIGLEQLLIFSAQRVLDINVAPTSCLSHSTWKDRRMTLRGPSVLCRIATIRSSQSHLRIRLPLGERRGSGVYQAHRLHDAICSIPLFFLLQPTQSWRRTNRRHWGFGVVPYLADPKRNCLSLFLGDITTSLKIRLCPIRTRTVVCPLR